MKFIIFFNHVDINCNLKIICYQVVSVNNERFSAQRSFIFYNIVEQSTPPDQVHTKQKPYSITANFLHSFFNELNLSIFI
jgi:hypothetical protein